MFRSYESLANLMKHLMSLNPVNTVYLFSLMFGFHLPLLSAVNRGNARLFIQSYTSPSLIALLTARAREFTWSFAYILRI